MQEYDAAVEIVVGEGRSFSQGERMKAVGPYDEIYLRERIRHHNRRQNAKRAVLVILYLSLLIAVYTVFFYPVDNPTSQVWLKGTIILLTVLSLLGIPFLQKNHGRNASILRVVCKLREAAQRAPESTTREAGQRG